MKVLTLVALCLTCLTWQAVVNAQSTVAPDETVVYSVGWDGTLAQVVTFPYRNLPGEDRVLVAVGDTRALRGAGVDASKRRAILESLQQHGLTLGTLLAGKKREDSDGKVIAENEKRSREVASYLSDEQKALLTDVVARADFLKLGPVKWAEKNGASADSLLEIRRAVETANPKLRHDLNTIETLAVNQVLDLLEPEHARQFRKNVQTVADTSPVPSLLYDSLKSAGLFSNATVTTTVPYAVSISPSATFEPPKLAPNMNRHVIAINDLVSQINRLDASEEQLKSVRKLYTEFIKNRHQIMSDAESYEDYCESVLKSLTSVLNEEQINRSKAFRHVAIFKRSGFADLASMQGLTRFGVTELSNKEIADLHNQIPQTAKKISDAVYKAEEAYVGAVFKAHPALFRKATWINRILPGSTPALEFLLY